ncbi:hypothetical protein ABEV00_08420 [Paenibacillus thiaminolyticus]|uniref:hypothetical protein n=1 Tax=Paenibacillus thiaminolyticus TaxID=49283 RepID=UPI003D2659BE
MISRAESVTLTALSHKVPALPFLPCWRRCRVRAKEEKEEKKGLHPHWAAKNLNAAEKEVSAMGPWIYVALLGAVLVVLGLLRPRTGNDSTELRRNMEETLEHYMRELETDNEKVISMIERMKKEGQMTDEALRKRIDQLEQRWSRSEERHAALEARVAELQAVRLWNGQAPVPQMEEAAQPAAQHSMPAEAATFPPEAEPVPDAEAEAQAESETPEPPTIRSRYPELFALADEQVPAGQIAERLSMPIGEVQLILQLGIQEGGRV